MPRVVPVPVLVAALLSLLIMAQSLLRHGALDTAVQETGGVQVASIALWAFAAVYALFRRAEIGVMAWPLAMAFALFGLREMDFHDWFYEPGFLQLAVFEGDTPLWQQAISAAGMLFILLVFGTVLVRGARPFLHALRQGRSWAWLIIAALAIAALSSGVDGITNKLLAFGIELTTGEGMVFVVLEEIMEMLFALLVIAALSVSVRDATAAVTA